MKMTGGRMKICNPFRGFCWKNAGSCVFLLLALIVVGCSGGVPSESDARDVFASKYQKNIDQGLVKIESFSKVNAQQGEMFGVKFYTVEYQASISWPKGLNTQCLGNNDNFKGWSCWMVDTRNVGQVETSTGELRFEKTEKGWKGKNGDVY
jgi:hypothetical protein